MAPSARDTIVIVGAGIIGLDVALVLAQRGLGRLVTVYAEHLPGDTSVTYTSPWAGCNFSSISGDEPNALRWDRAGYAHLARLASEEGDRAYVSRVHSTEYWDDMVSPDKIRTMAEYVEDFEILPHRNLPEGVRFGITSTTLIVNAPKHIEYLFLKLHQYGVTFVRRKIPSIQAAYESPDTRLVFNCTGNAARDLPGVEDPKCFPTRGQVVLAKAPRMQRNAMRYGKDYITYIIPRPGTDGHVILGGFMQRGVSDGSTYSHETEDILARTTELAPELARHPPSVITSFAGMRPSRDGGARIEREEIVINGQALPLVHNYGAGGTGFQAGYGMALDAVYSVRDILDDLVRHDTYPHL